MLISSHTAWGCYAVIILPPLRSKRDARVHPLGSAKGRSLAGLENRIMYSVMRDKETIWSKRKSFRAKVHSARSSHLSLPQSLFRIL
jgi:hypothetical protein